GRLGDEGVGDEGFLRHDDGAGGPGRYPANDGPQATGLTPLPQGAEVAGAVGEAGAGVGGEAGGEALGVDVERGQVVERHEADGADELPVPQLRVRSRLDGP